MPSFKTKVIGGTQAADRSEIRRALEILTDPGQTFELRGLARPKAVRSIVCRGDDLDRATEAAWDLSDMDGVYWTLNPCRPTLEKSARVGDILARRWLLIDVDAVRPVDVSATQEELIAASDLAIDVWEYLSGLGWPEPVAIDSGNGAHLLYRIDLPADKLAQGIVRDVLLHLAEKFDSDVARVDRSVHNASRISKLPGTWARKGEPTAERPHRMARLVSVPSPLEIVPAGQLKALGREEVKPEVNGHTKSPFVGVASNGTLAGYVRSAIERECGRILLTPPGGRNVALNRSAFSLGTMAGWPEMIEPVVRGTLLDVALRAGLDEAETRKTIESGWMAGAASPREKPADRDPRRNGASPQSLPRLARYTIGLHEVTAEKVDWLWENRIAIGFISIFAGRTGHAKSFVTCDLAARLSRGEGPPYSTLVREPMGTLIISEDPVSVMLAPRLNDMKADPKRIRFMTWEAMARFVISDTEMLKAMWEECSRPGLIVIDPPTNFLGGADEHKNAEIRAMLMTLVEWLDKNRVACVLITHINKAVGKGLDAVERIMGSVAWGSVARITVAFAKDSEGQFLCGGTKNNVGEIAEPLAFRIARDEQQDRTTIEWLGKSDSSIDDALNRVAKTNRTERAAQWLIERFREKLKWSSTELETRYRADGISRNGYFEAKKLIGIINDPVKNAAGQIDSYINWVPPSWKYLQEDFRDSGYSGTQANRKLNEQKDLCPKNHSTNQETVMGCRSTVPEYQSPEGYVGGIQGETQAGIQAGNAAARAQALHYLVGLLLDGPIPRQKAVALAAERDIPFRVLMEAATDLNVKRSVEDNQEIWSS